MIGVTYLALVLAIVWPSWRRTMPVASKYYLSSRLGSEAAAAGLLRVAAEALLVGAFLAMRAVDWGLAPLLLIAAALVFRELVRD